MSTANEQLHPLFDKQGDASDADRLKAALSSFLTDFGTTTAVHLEACVHCGLCAQACHFHLATGDAKYTPILKLEPLRQAYQQEASAFAPLLKKNRMAQRTQHRRLRTLAGVGV